ncbi:MAG: glycosyltransferase family 4 protein [Alphaproteobacteria bacterium]|nr:glycosyltransferase family 4 protein [Alphaproteobacteria bacterium]
MLNILTFTSLYPSAAQPVHGVFVENRLRHLVDSGKVKLRVVAPTPWFPFKGKTFGQYGVYAQTPRQETRSGISVIYPRFPVIPKFGMSLGPRLLYLALKPVLAKILSSGEKFDLIDAHYFYPDGVAAAMLGQAFNIPVVITARGTDINLIPQYDKPKRQILWAADKAAASITVCQALKDTLVELGADGAKIHALRNGVDLTMFKPGDREKDRQNLGLQGQTLLSVGHLIERKGHHLAIEALTKLPDCTLLIAGDGPERQNLESLTARLKLTDRVTFLGRIPHNNLAAVYGAVDALILASSREGWANVLLEAMACGTPVIASNVWGTPEIVATPESGVLMETRTADGLAVAARRLFDDMLDRAATRAYAEQFSWDATTQGQLDLFHAIAAAHRTA